jgi:hypothetical protein
MTGHLILVAIALLLAAGLARGAYHLTRKAGRHMGRHWFGFYGFSPRTGRMRYRPTMRQRALRPFERFFRHAVYGCLVGSSLVAILAALPHLHH